MNLNELRVQAYKIACEHGFHDTELSNEHWLCLAISELMEAVEADRKLKYANRKVFEEIIKLPHRDYTRKDVIWSSHFEAHIKDTIDDELADAAIRLLDFAGLRGIDIEAFTEEDIGDLSESCNSETFTESIYAISTIPIRTEYEYDYQLEKQLNCMLAAIFGLAKHLDIDLLWHIEQKMKYNQSREKMHGKEY